MKHTEGNAQVESDVELCPLLAHGLVRELRCAADSAVAIPNWRWTPISACSKLTERTRESASLLASAFHVADVIHALRRIIFDACGATINVPPVSEVSSDYSMLSSHTRQHSTDSKLEPLRETDSTLFEACDDSNGTKLDRNYAGRGRLIILGGVQPKTTDW